METLIGTSGYDYADWVGEGLLYPASLAKNRADWLTYYASQFPIAELNFTYYGETSAAQVEAMLQRVEPERVLYLLEGQFAPREDFSFVVKAYAALTHEVERDWRAKAAQFRGDTAPLRDAGRLTAVLAQFPSRMHYRADNLDYICSLAEELQPAPLVAEFRHRSWFTRDIQQELEARGVVFCLVDAPGESSLPSLGLFEPGRPEPVPPVKMPQSVPFSYLRIHGRNEGSWWTGDAGSRYHYHYSPEQLRALAEQLLSTVLERAYVLFNNHQQADAVKNARTLEEILKGLLRGREEERDQS
jgi:uncharacterized protein YecE (DUF72 family)